MNIKNIGKELMGKSLNSYHRKTGLTQLEENNKMQDRILNGILSQVDDAYIEKTEQSNVIHLEGSGDGVVVLDNIEGNTMVNHIPKIQSASYLNEMVVIDDEYITIDFSKGNGTEKSIFINLKNELPLIQNKTYTYRFDIVKNTTVIKEGFEGQNAIQVEWGFSDIVSARGYVKYSDNSIVKLTTNTNNRPSPSNRVGFYIRVGNGTEHYCESGVLKLKSRFVMIEGTHENIPCFHGLQSSFEEKVNDEGKYEIEILSHNNNVIPPNAKFKFATYKGAPTSPRHYNQSYTIHSISTNRALSEPLKITKNKKMYFRCDGYMLAHAYYDKDLMFVKDNGWKSNTTYLNPPNNAEYICSFIKRDDNAKLTILDLEFIEKNAILGCYESFEDVPNIAHKTNKIKVLLDEPLRAVGDAKDRLCVKDGKLVVERKCGNVILDSERNYGGYSYQQANLDPIVAYCTYIDNIKININEVICDKLPYNKNSVHSRNQVGIATFYDSNNSHIRFCFNKNTLGITETLVNGGNYIPQLKEYLKSNPLTVVYQLKEPYYEEVTNEYGEPIILEGYENGTLYIDSTIVPTTTVKYTPKMASFNTLKEVSNSNVMLTNDINDTIIPYLMEVDLMIMEKEMVLINQNTRAIGVKDMTSMQKRTQDMLERLIKGKTLTEQECKTRVTTYLNADKITDEQAEELMLLILEVYV